MLLFVFPVLLAGLTMAQNPPHDPNVQETVNPNHQYNAFPAQSYQPISNYHNNYNPELQARQGPGLGFQAGVNINPFRAPASPGFFNIAGPYVTGLVTTFAFVFGTILIFDLIFADANILKRITGRDGKSISEIVDVNTVIDAADQVYSAIQKFQDLQHKELPK